MDFTATAGGRPEVPSSLPLYSQLQELGPEIPQPVNHELFHSNSEIFILIFSFPLASGDGCEDDDDEVKKKREKQRRRDRMRDRAMDR